MNQQYLEAATYINERIPDFPDIAILTGTGLGFSDDQVDPEGRIPYRGIPNFPAVSSRGHDGELRIATLSGHRVALFSGRLHYYEGHRIETCGYPIHLMNALGVKNLIMSNVSGSVNSALKKSTIVLLRDHINLMGVNPLRAHRNPEGFISFPEMRNAYAKKYHPNLIAACADKGISLKEGVYAAFAGPSLETPQEYKMVQILGGDLVGMSTVPEVIVAASYGMETNVLSLVSNECFDGSPEPTSIESVLDIANRQRPVVYETISILVEQIKSGKTD